MSSEKDPKQQQKHPGKDAAPKAQGEKREGKPQGNKPKGAPKHAEVDDVPAGPRVEPRLQTRFKSEIRAKLAADKGVKNPMSQPKLEKIVLNVNMGRHLEGTKIPPNVKQTILDTVQKVTGQKPVVVLAKKSVSNFKVREGLETSVVVTLRRDRMWHFLDRFINLACPRIKDFRGLNEKGFDRQGNYACGLQEQGVFPEINMADVTFTHGMNINFCFANSTPDLSRFVLTELGMPFRKPEEKPARK